MRISSTVLVALVVSPPRSGDRSTGADRIRSNPKLTLRSLAALCGLLHPPTCPGRTGRRSRSRAPTPTRAPSRGARRPTLEFPRGTAPPAAGQVTSVPPRACTVSSRARESARRSRARRGASSRPSRPSRAGGSFSERLHERRRLPRAARGRRPRAPSRGRVLARRAPRRRVRRGVRHGRRHRARRRGGAWAPGAASAFASAGCFGRVPAPLPVAWACEEVAVVAAAMLSGASSEGMPEYVRRLVYPPVGWIPDRPAPIEIVNGFDPGASLYIQ